MNEIKNIGIEKYHSGEGVSRSMLLELRKTPFHYYSKFLSGNKQAQDPPPVINRLNALEFGNAFHTLILEPEKFDAEYLVIPKINRATKAGKETFKAYLETSQGTGAKLLCEESFKIMQNIQESISANAEASGALGGALYERSMFWIDPDTDIQCKARPDAWHDNMIVDLKTAANADLRSFQRSIVAGGYHLQAAMMAEGILHTQGVVMDNFVYVVVEKDEPHAVATYILDCEALEEGRKQFKKLLQKLKYCTDNNHWPSYDTSTVTLPAYAVDEV